MPPRVGSRHTFSSAYLDTDGETLFLGERVPFLYRELGDNRRIPIRQGDTWFSLASFYFRPIPRAAGFWWVITDFQPDGPIVDPTIPPTPGTEVIVPSVETLTSQVFDESRRRDH
jgi:hypothetical protein